MTGEVRIDSLLTIADAVRDARAAARIANAAESAGRADWKLCWEACRLWCVASGLTKGVRAKDYSVRAWSWARKTVELKETLR
jgi:hypothetical protein